MVRVEQKEEVGSNLQEEEDQVRHWGGSLFLGSLLKTMIKQSSDSGAVIIH